MSNVLVTNNDSASRNNLGQFQRKIKDWSLRNFNEGYIDSKNRFRIILPNHPRAYKGGYILRSIVAYERYHNVKVPKNMRVHHIDGNTLNDSKDNLELLTEKEHKCIHFERNGNRIERICENCKKSFIIQKYRLDSKDHNRGRFCSQKCFHEFPRSEKHKENISKGLKRAYENWVR